MDTVSSLVCLADKALIIKYIKQALAVLLELQENCCEKGRSYILDY
ncbi:Uncharacterized protein dnl_61820 [Desulfonema limicola]|uniref:Uncharacterized protein n=1 Tax=Desulfonema limicola TaxID=45656 RepID=A0A975BDZ2_9BACT|nr:hypothetical protein [Desulfonema limicola]QTA83767.1 Uncharacterized protein dnl_61820 [Desulfonema limicola]